MKEKKDRMRSKNPVFSAGMRTEKADQQVAYFR